MPVSDICNREVIIVQRETTVNEAAKLMRQHHVGSVVVVEERKGVKVPVGIVTDRDLVVEVMAPDLVQMVITVADIMGQKLVTVQDGMGIYESIQYMRGEGVRRLPVVDSKGGLIGILALDDLLELLAEELLDLSRLVKHEQKKESISRR
ncbi:MAG TPA: CBS domain-containing protein [Gallionellaceae bacterium]|nr:CBS domain-containing protein [Gallionellaceae bacterium]